MSEDDKPAILVETLCDKHRRDLLVRRLKVPESGPWMATELTVQLLLVGRIMGMPSIVKRAEGDGRNLPLIIAEIGCLACFDRRGYTMAAELIRDRGLDVAAKVAQREVTDPLWSWT